MYCVAFRLFILNWWNYSYWIERKWLTLWNKKNQSFLCLFNQRPFLQCLSTRQCLYIYFIFEKTFPINIKIQIHFIYAFQFFSGILLRTKADFLCLRAMDVGFCVGREVKLVLREWRNFWYLIKERSNRVGKDLPKFTIEIHSRTFRQMFWRVCCTLRLKKRCMITFVV